MARRLVQLSTMKFLPGFHALAVGLVVAAGSLGCGGPDLVAHEVVPTSSSVAPGSATADVRPSGTSSTPVTTATAAPSASAIASAEPPPPRGCGQVTEEAIYIDVSSRESPAERDQRREVFQTMRMLLIGWCTHKQDPEVLSPCVVEAGKKEANADRLAALRACYGGRFPPKM